MKIRSGIRGENFLLRARISLCLSFSEGIGGIMED